MGLACRWASENDFGAIRDFLAAAFGPGSVQCAPGRFEWLFAGRPAGPHISLACDGDRIVGFRGYMPWPIRLGRRNLTAGYAIDTMILPEYRRRGIGGEFLRMWTERYPIGLSSGQSASMANLYRKTGFRKVAPVRRHFIVRRPQAGSSPRVLARDLVAWGKRLSRRRDGGSRRELDPQKAVRLCGTLGVRNAPHEAAVWYDPDLFLWRFCGPVYTDYRFFEIRGTGADARGLLVSRSEPGTEVLCELICPPREREGLIAVAAATSRAPRLAAYCSGAGLERGFASAGALTRPHGGAVAVVTGDPEIQELIDRLEWFHFAGEGDADMIRPPAAGLAQADRTRCTPTTERTVS